MDKKAARSTFPRYQPPRFPRCIFCEGEADSKEHLLPDWLRRALAEGDGDFVDIGWSEESGGEAAAICGRGNGGVNSIKLKCVCKVCNTKWMSGLQNAAKPVLRLLAVDGDWPSLTEDDRRRMARWAVMASMVYDAADQASTTITQASRSAFCENGEPPSNWVVWIGRRQDSSRDRWAGHVSYQEASGLPKHSQATAFGLAKATVMTFSSNFAPTFHPDWMAERLSLRAIWPQASPWFNEAPCRWRTERREQAFYDFTKSLRLSGPNPP